MNSAATNVNENEGMVQDHSVRLPSWIGVNERPLYSCLHLPTKQALKNYAVLICNPFGYEYTHAHRSIRHLADKLADNGYAVLRFDFHGTGNSDASLHGEHRVASWLEDIEQAVDFLKNKTGASKICLLGIRIGATLAASFTEHHAVDRLVLWDVCSNGKRYVREMKAVARMAANGSESEKAYIDSAGFIMTRETATDIKNIQLAEQNFQVKSKILLLERNDLKTNTKLQDALRRQGHSIDQVSMPGYTEMMAEPQDAQVPLESIALINHWLPDDSDASAPLTKPRELRLQSTLPTYTEQEGAGISEDIYWGGSKMKLFGILTRPQQTVGKELTPLIVFLNSGSVHHVGPNRIYADLSRQLATQGQPCLRMDFSNLGDSVIGHPENENHAYPREFQAEIRSLLNDLKQRYGYRRIILSGLCSGAHNAFHAGLQLEEDFKIVESILINPLTFYKNYDNPDLGGNAYSVEKESIQYGESIFDLSKWWKLIKGEADTTTALRFIFKKVAKVISSRFKHMLDLIGLSHASDLSRDLTQYEKDKRHISFFLAENDIGYNITMTAAKNSVTRMLKNQSMSLYMIKDADHTFSKTPSRQDFIKQYVAHITARYH